MGKPISTGNSKAGLSYDDMLNDDFTFDMDSHDVMVFLHMQKTGKENLLLFLKNIIASAILQEELLLASIWYTTWICKGHVRVH